MKLYLSNIQNKDKPDSYAIKKISNTILNNLVDISLEEFATELTERGKTVVLAELSEKKLSKTTPIIGQDLIMLDFDNKDLNNIYTIDDLESDIFMQNNAVFYYRTFSDVESKVDKFRVVFQLNEVIESNDEIEEIYQKLFEMYPQADSSVGQTNRMFFGSNSGYGLIDSDNRLAVSEILDRYEKKELFETNVYGEIIDDNLPNYLLLKMGLLDLVRNKLGDNYSGTFSDEYNAINYFCSLDIREILELPEENPFCDILHKEENPSTSIYYAEDLDCYFYKCFSEKNTVTVDIKGLLSLYLNKDNFEIIQILTYITNSKITMDSDVGRLKLNATVFKKELINGKLERTRPELYFYLKRYIAEISLIIEYMFDYVYKDSKGDIQVQNYYSIETLAKMLSRSLNRKISINKTKNILNIIIVTEIIQKVPEDSIVEELYNTVISEQKMDTTRVRTSNVYKPILLVESHKKYMGEVAKILKENDVTISSLSYELIYRLFGEEKAKQDFPQSYKPLEEKGLIKMSKQDSNLTNKSIQLEKSIVKIINNEIELNGYIFEKDLISKLARAKNKKIETIRHNYNKIRADVLNKYMFKREKTTKSLYLELGIKQEYSPKIVIFK